MRYKSRIRRTLGGIACTLLAGIVCTPLAVGADQPKLTNESIRDAVEDEFLFDPGVSRDAIDVDVADGVVTLSGKTNSLLEKERAVRVAETVKGVRAVVDRLTVKPIKNLTDAELKRDVESALLMDPATDSYEIQADVKNGAVTLKGHVDSWTERTLCERVAKGVRGVTSVNDDILVKYAATRSDAEIQAEIEKKLRWDALIDDALIDVKVADGNVTLSGTVGSAAERSRAAASSWVAGVKSVNDDGLSVSRWARDPDLRESKYVIKSDEALRDAVKDALMYDPRVFSFNVTPKAHNGTVTLRGIVDNLKAKHAAAEDARDTVGVRSVKNRLQVRPAEGVSDETVEQNVREALLRDPYVSRYEITVSAHDGTLDLYGTVDSYFEKGEAEDVASRVNGVVAVRNHLNVSSARDWLAYNPYVYDWNMYGWHRYGFTPRYTTKSDTEIKDDIESELWWSPFVDSDEVHVDVDDGVATLTGTVDTWAERQAATDNAYEGGATRVDNELAVKVQ